MGGHMNKHTELPWIDGLDFVESPSARLLVCECYERYDAAFIVRAVNSHDELVDSCRKLLEIIESDDCKFTPNQAVRDYVCKQLERAKAALALAEKGEEQ